MTAVLTETSGGWCESCCHVSDSLLAAALQDGKFSQLNISKGPVKKKPSVQLCKISKYTWLPPPPRSSGFGVIQGVWGPPSGQEVSWSQRRPDLQADESRSLLWD